jgi:hypothetical protein
MRTIATAAAVAVLALSGCGVQAPSPPAAPPVTSTAPATSAPTEASTPPTPARPSAKRIKVPDVVGVNHQTAQNTMQAIGLFHLREQDATGQGRLLIWDRNWVVVRQTPRAGKKVAPETVITLFSRKIGE